MADPDKLFGRHLAVLGNTGSGNSCTVAGLIRWSMEAAEKEIKVSGKTGVPNARFIVLDPNGEYARAFADRGDELRLFRVPPVTGGERPLDVPAWLWSGHEWTAVAHAQPWRAASIVDARPAGAEGWPNGGSAQRGDDSPLSWFLFDPDIGNAERRHTGLRGGSQTCLKFLSPRWSAG